MARILTLIGAACALLILAAAPAAAQPAGPAASPVDPDAEVLVLLTQRVADEAGATPTTRYWWVSPQEPAWSETDRLLADALGQAAIGLSRPDAGLRISRIYQTPNLSVRNAASLASLMGARRVVVGTVSYERRTPLGLLGLAHWVATVDAELVSTTTDEPTVLRRFEVERHGFAPADAAALEQVRAEVGGTLGRTLAASVRRSAGPVGVATDETLLAIRDAGDARTLQAVERFVEGLDGVDAVAVRWAAEGLIALEINPGKADPPDRLEYVRRALTNQPFEAFALRPADAKIAGARLLEVVASPLPEGQ